MQPQEQTPTAPVPTYNYRSAIFYVKHCQPLPIVDDGAQHSTTQHSTAQRRARNFLGKYFTGIYVEMLEFKLKMNGKQNLQQPLS